MTESIYEKVYNEALTTAIADAVSKVFDKKFEELKDNIASPYVNGIKGLAVYLGIGETLANKLHKDKEIKSSRFGREIWFRKSDIDKFMAKHQE
jgi:excisionase family DNA binding protein